MVDLNSLTTLPLAFLWGAGSSSRVQAGTGSRGTWGGSSLSACRGCLPGETSRGWRFVGPSRACGCFGTGLHKTGSISTRTRANSAVRETTGHLKQHGQEQRTTNDTTQSRQQWPTIHHLHTGHVQVVLLFYFNSVYVAPSRTLAPGSRTRTHTGAVPGHAQTLFLQPKSKSGRR